MTETATARQPTDDELIHADNPHHARWWLILGIIGLVQLMVVLDSLDAPVVPLGGGSR